jgi:hypothetical protein
MPAPQNNQGFVQPSSGGTGNWLSKLFGGIGDNARARSMAQLQLDLHAGKADIDTFHKKDRMTYQTAMGEYTANETYKRSGKEIRRGIKKGPEMGQAGVAGFDRNGRPIMQKTGQKTGSKQKTDDSTTINPDDNTPPPPPPPGPTPPPDRGANPGRKTRARKTDAGATATADTTPPTTKNSNKTKVIDTKSNQSSGPIDGVGAGKEKQEELFPGYGPTFDGDGNNTQSPAGKAAAAKRARTPKTPKAGA